MGKFRALLRIGKTTKKAAGKAGAKAGRSAKAAASRTKDDIVKAEQAAKHLGKTIKADAKVAGRTLKSKAKLTRQGIEHHALQSQVHALQGVSKTVGKMDISKIPILNRSPRAERYLHHTRSASKANLKSERMKLRISKRNYVKAKKQHALLPTAHPLATPGALADYAWAAAKETSSRRARRAGAIRTGTAAAEGVMTDEIWPILKEEGSLMGLGKFGEVVSPSGGGIGSRAKAAGTGVARMADYWLDPVSLAGDVGGAVAEVGGKDQPYNAGPGGVIPISRFAGGVLLGQSGSEAATGAYKLSGRKIWKGIADSQAKREQNVAYDELLSSTGQGKQPAHMRKAARESKSLPMRIAETNPEYHELLARAANRALEDQSEAERPSQKKTQGGGALTQTPAADAYKKLKGKAKQIKSGVKKVTRASKRSQRKKTKQSQRKKISQAARRAGKRGNPTVKEQVIVRNKVGETIEEAMDRVKSEHPDLPESSFEFEDPDTPPIAAEDV